MIVCFNGFFRRTSSFSPIRSIKRFPTIPTVRTVPMRFSTTETTGMSEKEWDLKGLKAEANRQYLRTFKKISKSSERMRKFSELDDSESLTETQNDIESQQKRLASLKYVDDCLKDVKSVKEERFLGLLDLINSLELSDSPPPKQERGPKKVKGAPHEPRKPYFVYKSCDDIEIRVGRGAGDNDELSCNPLHRDGSDWWLHVSGYAGSHVVIRNGDEDVLTKYKETVYDAALLAAINSKANQSGKVPVTLTRCRYVTKPPGAKDGLVRINGDVTIININIKLESAKRLVRLQKL